MARPRRRGRGARRRPRGRRRGAAPGAAVGARGRHRRRLLRAAGGDLPDLKLADAEVVEIGRRRSVTVWDRWWYLAALAGVLGTEWILRRRWGW